MCDTRDDVHLPESLRALAKALNTLTQDPTTNQHQIVVTCAAHQTLHAFSQVCVCDWSFTSSARHLDMTAHHLISCYPHKSRNVFRNTAVWCRRGTLLWVSYRLKAVSPISIISERLYETHFSTNYSVAVCFHLLPHRRAWASEFQFANKCDFSTTLCSFLAMETISYLTVGVSKVAVYFATHIMLLIELNTLSCSWNCYTEGCVLFLPDTLSVISSQQSYG